MYYMVCITGYEYFEKKILYMYDYHAGVLDIVSSQVVDCHGTSRGPCEALRFTIEVSYFVLDWSPDPSMD